MPFRLPIVAAACALLALPAAAQTLKPGLWEMQHKAGGTPRMDQAMAEMRQQMDAMSPEERRQMESMMAGRGMQMGRAADGGMAMKVCLTPQMVQRNDIPASRGDCRTTRQQRSGSTLTMAFTCTDPPSTGESQVTFHGPEAFTSRSTIASTVDGRSETMTMEGSGKWLSADCGSVKPIAPK